MSDLGLKVTRNDDDLFHWPSQSYFDTQAKELSSFLPISPLSKDICMLIIFSLQQSANKHLLNSFLVPDLSDTKKALEFVKGNLVGDEPHWVNNIVSHFEKNVESDSLIKDVALVIDDFVSWSKDN